MDPISVAMALAQFAPSIIKWITGDDKSAAVAEKVVDMAKIATGASDPAAALDAIKLDPAAVMRFKEMVMANEADLEKAYLADRDSARRRDMEFMKAGKRNVRGDVLAGLAVLATLALTVAVWRTPDLNEYVKGTFTLVLGRFLGYIDQVYAFEFGTSRGSKDKDETVKRLVAK